MDTILPRWEQKLTSYHRALNRLAEVVNEMDKRQLNDFEADGLVQRFEFTFELAWKVLQDLLEYKGYEFMSGPNGTLKMAFEDGLITNHEGWRKMAKSRNTLSHVYDDEEARAITSLIFSEYAPLLKELDDELEALSQDQQYQQS